MTIISLEVKIENHEIWLPKQLKAPYSLPFRGVFIPFATPFSSFSLSRQNEEEKKKKKKEFHSNPIPNPTQRPELS